MQPTKNEIHLIEDALILAITHLKKSLTVYAENSRIPQRFVNRVERKLNEYESLLEKLRSL